MEWLRRRCLPEKFDFGYPEILALWNAYAAVDLLATFPPQGRPAKRKTLGGRSMGHVPVLRRAHVPAPLKRCRLKEPPVPAS